MALEAADGINATNGEAVVKRVPETVPEDRLKSTGAWDPQQQFQHIPIANADDLPEFDGFVWITPTRFGNMSAQFRNLLDRTGGLWYAKKLIRKPVTVMTSTSSQGGGAQTTIQSIWNTAIHHGMIVVGLPYELEEFYDVDSPNISSPYGAATFTGADGKRGLSDAEKVMIRHQAANLTQIARKLMN
ncbi:hypothetical protein GEMRC1_008133 [Eukaryota sp. GEM-RC1]